MLPIISYEDFAKIDIRSGTVIKAELFLRAAKPAYKVWVDFGSEIGTLQTSAQVTMHYTIESLIGRQVLGAINLGGKNIAGFISQFLMLGCLDSQNNVVLATLERNIPNGQRLF